MPTYNVLQDFGLTEEADSLSLSAAAVIAVFRRKYPVTYSRKKRGSISQNTKYAVELRDRVTIVDDISSITVSSNKSSHVTSASIELKPGANYISELLPGDFIFIWMVQHKEKAQEILQKLDEGKPCNEWDDGLKFFGRINACRKRLVTEPTAGIRRTSFMVNASGFTELDASIYFEPYMALPPQGAIVSWLQYFGVAIRDFISSQNGGVTTNIAVPTLYNILFGEGVPKNAKIKVSDVRLTEGLDNPNTFLIPQPVAGVFGVTQGTKPGGLIGWTDIMYLIHGVQKYIDGEIKPEDKDYRGNLMHPQISGGKGKALYTGKEQMGTFTPQVAAFTGQKNVWTILSQFVNTSVNEMYTCMRANRQGQVFPTLVLRQLPFTSGLISATYKPSDPLTPEQRKHANAFKRKLQRAGGERSEAGKKLLADYQQTDEYKQHGWTRVGVTEPIELMHEVTRFVELPRWRIPPVMVKSFDVGRSDALRMNYVHVYGEAGVPAGVNQSRQFAINKPVRDDLDIARSGLRPYMATVPCSPKDIVKGGAGAWMNLIADIVMNQELTLTGLINTYGIVGPIAPGDNIEYDGVLAHIEAVNHVFSVSPTGVCSFVTNVEFSHGLSADQLSVSSDQARYVGLKTADLSSFDPAVSSDGPNPSVGTGEDTSSLQRQTDIETAETYADSQEPGATRASEKFVIPNGVDGGV